MFIVDAFRILFVSTLLSSEMFTSTLFRFTSPKILFIATALFVNTVLFKVDTALSLLELNAVSPFSIVILFVLNVVSLLSSNPLYLTDESLLSDKSTILWLASSSLPLIIKIPAPAVVVVSST